MGLFDTLFGKQETAGVVEFEELERLDVGEAAKEGLKFQEENIEQAQRIARTADVEAQQRSFDLLEQALPGFSDFQAQLGDVFSEIAVSPFELPSSVESLIRQQAAERGIRGGFAGSEFGDFDVVRNLGMEALQLGNQRIGQAQSLFQTLVGTAPTVNPTSALSLMPGAGTFIAGEEFNIQNVDKYNIENRQMIAQMRENQRAAAASKPGILGGIVSGAIQGGMAGGPWGALAGAGIGAAGGLAGFGAGDAGQLGGFAGQGVQFGRNNNFFSSIVGGSSGPASAPVPTPQQVGLTPVQF